MSDEDKTCCWVLALVVTIMLGVAASCVTYNMTELSMEHKAAARNLGHFEVRDNGDVEFQWGPKPVLEKEDV